LKKLRDLDPGVKAIVSSGYSNDPIMADFGKHGFNGVVTMPYRIKELSEEVYRVING
jgi:DNA-binding NarL/FixJ family response regulator